jgi:hypothetical protein
MPSARRLRSDNITLLRSRLKRAQLCPISSVYLSEEALHCIAMLKFIGSDRVVSAYICLRRAEPPRNFHLNYKCYHTIFLLKMDDEGIDPPTSPMLREHATICANHPSYRHAKLLLILLLKSHSTFVANLLSFES